MKVTLDIEFEDAIVLILGAGVTALRKARQYVLAGAEVYIYSLAYDAGFDALDVHRITKNELEELLPKARLAIACTNDAEANRAFIYQADRYGILTMCAQRDCGQNAHPMKEMRNDHFTIAVNTNGAFPIANMALMNEMENRVHLMMEIRNHLTDKSLSKLLPSASDALLLFMRNASITKKAILYVLHGSHGTQASDEAMHLCHITEETFPVYTAGFIFIGRKHITMPLTSLLTVLTDMDVHCLCVPLFFEAGSYRKEAENIIHTNGFPLIDIPLNPSFILQDGEHLFTHVQPKNDDHAILVSMLYSPYLRSQNKDVTYRIYLEDPFAIEDILMHLKEVLL